MLTSGTASAWIKIQKSRKDVWCTYISSTMNNIEVRTEENRPNLEEKFEGTYPQITSIAKKPDAAINDIPVIFHRQMHICTVVMLQIFYIDRIMVSNNIPLA